MEKRHNNISRFYPYQQLEVLSSGTSIVSIYNDCKILRKVIDIHLTKVGTGKNYLVAFDVKNYISYSEVSINSKNDVDIEESINRLEQDESNSGLDYIFTVDMFNEGIDVLCCKKQIK